MFILGGFLGVFFVYWLPSIQKSTVTIWEIYFVGILLPYALGAFLTFAFGDLICLKLKLYKNSDAYTLDNSASILSLHEDTDTFFKQNRFT